MSHGDDVVNRDKLHIDRSFQSFEVRSATSRSVWLRDPRVWVCGDQCHGLGFFKEWKEVFKVPTLIGSKLVPDIILWTRSAAKCQSVDTTGAAEQLSPMKEGKTVIKYHSLGETIPGDGDYSILRLWLRFRLEFPIKQWFPSGIEVVDCSKQVPVSTRMARKAMYVHGSLMIELFWRNEPASMTPTCSLGFAESLWTLSAW
jgi:hypothetical protein